MVQHTPPNKEKDHAQRGPLGYYNRWQDSFSHQNCPSMGKGKTGLPKAPGEMLKTTKGSAHPPPSHFLIGFVHISMTT